MLHLSDQVRSTAPAKVSQKVGGVSANKVSTQLWKTSASNHTAEISDRSATVRDFYGVDTIAIDARMAKLEAPMVVSYAQQRIRTSAFELLSNIRERLTEVSVDEADVILRLLDRKESIDIDKAAFNGLIESLQCPTEMKL